MRTGTRRRRTALRAAALSLATAAVTGAAAAASLPGDVAGYLREGAGFAPDRLAALEAGEVVARTAADDGGVLSVVGAVRIRTTKAQLLSYFDQYLKDEDGVVVLRVGRFGKPAVLEDVERLTLEKADVEALRSCKPGDCDVRVGAGIAQLRAAIDWRAPDYADEVDAFVRQRLVDYVNAYEKEGDAALVTYNDKSKPVSLADRWRALLAASKYLHGYAPELQRYLQDYPRATLPGGHDFIQWTKVDQGLKPVVAVAHVVVYDDPAKADRFSAAMKQIYASRFSEGAFSLMTVVEAGPTDGRPTCYVVLVSRTQSDRLRGALGGVKRKVVTSEVLKSTEVTLRQIQEVLEKAAGVP